MALISCPECGKQTSDKFAKCFRCGATVGQDSKTTLNKITNRTKTSNEQGINNSQVLVILLVLFGTILFATIWYNMDHPTNIGNQNKLSNSQIENDSENRQRVEEVNTQNNSVENQARKSEIEKQPSLDDQLALKIVLRTYQWYEDGSAASISFQYQDNPSKGTMVLTGSIHTLEYRYEGDRNAIDAITDPERKCSFVYNYEIRGNYIVATFAKSTCGYDGSNHTFTYNVSDNTISSYTGQGEMIFKP